MAGKFYGIGLGPGDPGLVTLKAADALRSVKAIYSVASRQSDRSISGRILDALPGNYGGAHRAGIHDVQRFRGAARAD